MAQVIRHDIDYVGAEYGLNNQRCKYHNVILDVFDGSRYNASMKVNSSIIASFVVGAIVASLPYTLSSGKTVAQGAGPNQGQGQGQGFPPQQGGPQGFPGQGQGQFGQGQGFGQGQQRFGGSPMVNSMTSAGNNLFVAAGDTIYKIDIDSMAIKGQTKLPQPRPQQDQGQNRGGAGRPGNGGGSIPPSNK